MVKFLTMPELTEVTKLARVAQAVEVTALRFQHPDWTIEKACEEVGITEKVYRTWVYSGEGLIEAARGLIGQMQRKTLIDISAAKAKAIEMLIEDAINEHTSTKDRVLALNYLEKEVTELQRVLHAAPGIEEKAHDFLKKGPKIERKQSRLASVHIEPDETGGVDVTVYQDQEIIDAEARDVPLLPQE
jgi:hypothetical protein